MIHLSEIATKAKSIWQDLSFRGKVAIAVTPFFMVVLFAFLVVSRGDNFVPICEDEDDRKVVFALIDGLDEAGIDYRLASGGHSVLVPYPSFTQAAGIYSQAVTRENDDSQVEGSSFFSGGLFGGRINSKNSEIRMREKHLARNISCYKGVRSARVMITPPDSRIFARKEHKEPRASVFLELSNDEPLNACRIEGVRQLVAASYHGLLEDNVSITDSIGTDYTLIARKNAINEREETGREQQMIETQIQQKVERHLSVMFGRQNVSVAASVALGKDRKNRQSKIENLCLSVFVNEEAQGFNRWSAEVKESLVTNISSVARIDRARGDTVSVLVVPFDDTAVIGPARPVVSTVQTATKPKESLKSVHPALVVAKSSIQSEPSSVKPVKSSSPVALSTVNYLGFPFHSSSSASGYVIGIPLFMSLLCVALYILRRRGSVEEDEGDLWHPVSGFEFADIEGTYCSLSDYDPLHGNEELLYKEEVVTRTAVEEPDVIASLIRRNENLKNSDW